jgi:hypothetical protein
MSNEAKFDSNDILTNPSLPVVYTRIRSLAKELAVLGKINYASQITDLVLSQNRTEHGIGLMACLNYAFEQTGDWPASIPASARTKHALHKLDTLPSGAIDEQRYDEIINETAISQRDPALCLTIAVALCEKAGRTEVEHMQQDERVARALNQIAERFDRYIDELTRHRKIWPLLASGVLAQHLGVDDGKLTATAELAVETVRTRIEKGRQKGVHDGKPIKDLLEILAENTRKNAGSLYEEMDKVPTESYLHEPATEEDIKDLENRLKISPLPDDYTEFLRASNGCEALYDGQNIWTPFHRAQEIVLTSPLPEGMKLSFELVQDSTGTAQLQREFGYDDWPSLTTCVEIGRNFEPAFLFAGPADVKATVAAYQKALASDKVSDAMKLETTQAIEDLYGSMEAFEKLEWVMIFDIQLDPCYTVGTFRGWMERAAQESSKPRDSSSGNSCLAYRCRV